MHRKARCAGECPSLHSGAEPPWKSAGPASIGIASGVTAMSIFLRRPFFLMGFLNTRALGATMSSATIRQDARRDLKRRHGDAHDLEDQLTGQENNRRTPAVTQHASRAVRMVAPPCRSASWPGTPARRPADPQSRKRAGRQQNVFEQFDEIELDPHARQCQSRERPAGADHGPHWNGFWNFHPAFAARFARALHLKRLGEKLTPSSNGKSLLAFRAVTAGINHLQFRILLQKRFARSFPVMPPGITMSVSSKWISSRCCLQTSRASTPWKLPARDSRAATGFAHEARRRHHPPPAKWFRRRRAWRSTGLLLIFAGTSRPGAADKCGRSSLADFAVNIDPALMLLNDAKHGGQPQAGAFADILGGEERFEDPRQNFRRDAAAGVAHTQADKRTGPGLGELRAAASSNSTPAVSMMSWPPLGMASRALTARFIST